MAFTGEQVLNAARFLSRRRGIAAMAVGGAVLGGTLSSSQGEGFAGGAFRGGLYGGVAGFGLRRGLNTVGRRQWAATSGALRRGLLTNPVGSRRFNAAARSLARRLRGDVAQGTHALLGAAQEFLLP